MTPVTETELKVASIAPRITEEELEANIVEIHCFNVGEVLRAGGNTSVHPSLYLLTQCVLVLKNGFTITGESACASPENFNQEFGSRLAYADAKKKIWPLMGYELRTKLQTRAGGQLWLDGDARRNGIAA